MNTFKLLKILVMAFAVIIIVLLGILIFVKPVQGPTVPGTAPKSTVPQPAVSPDGNVTVTSPLSGTLIASPVTVGGSVTGGGWFFEAVFPVSILDGDGTMLGGGQAQAQSDWMTTGTVPFSASIPFTAPRYATGTIVFAKDNPSGIPEKGEEFSVPVRFR